MGDLKRTALIVSVFALQFVSFAVQLAGWVCDRLANVAGQLDDAIHHTAGRIETVIDRIEIRDV